MKLLNEMINNTPGIGNTYFKIKLDNNIFKQEDILYPKQVWWKKLINKISFGYLYKSLIYETSFLEKELKCNGVEVGSFTFVIKDFAKEIKNDS